MKTLTLVKWSLLTFIVILWILGTIGIGIQVYQTPPSAGSTAFIEMIKIVFLTLGGLGVILPTYLNIWQSIENNQIIKERLEFDRLNNSMSLIDKWDNSDLFKARKFTRDLKKQRSNLSDNDLIKKVEEEEDLKQSVILIFNYFEQVRVSVLYGGVIESIIRQSLSDVYIDIYQRLLPWIKTSDNQQYQADLKSLYDRWHK